MGDSPRFVRQTAARCEDCEHRGDLKNEGSIQRDSDGLMPMSVITCAGCGTEVGSRRGRGFIRVSWIDPYASPVDASDPYARRRAERAALARIDHAPRPLRRRFLDRARIEALMTEES